MNTALAAQTVLQDIQEPAAYGGNPPFWAEALAALPAGILPFLDPATLSARRAAAGLPAGHDAGLAGMAATVAADPALRCLAWYLHWRMFIAPEHDIPWGAPSLLRHLGERAGTFYMLLALEFAPRLSAWHRQLGYPQTVTDQTLRQITAFESNHLRGRGVSGIYESQFPWLATYLVQPYVRLGRLEYQLHSYAGGVSVWKRATDGQVLALAEEGTRVADDGLQLAATAPASAGWTARLEDTAGAVTGFPVDPAGRILRMPVRLDRTAWTPCFSKGTTVLDLHIPAGGGMDWDAIVASLREALDFFPRHHPDRPFAALVVNTWFMDPRLADLLPAESNPLRFQRAVYLHPVPPNPGSLWFVFLRDTATADPTTLPRDTSLQRRLAGFLEGGGTWHGGGMFLLPEEMRHPREGFYRDRFRALRLDPG
jgi:hypothetical protein